MNSGLNIFFPSVGKWPFRQFKTKGGLSWGSISGQPLDDKGPYETLALPCSGPVGRLLGPVSGESKGNYKNLIHRPAWDFDLFIIRALLRFWSASVKDPSRTRPFMSWQRCFIPDKGSQMVQMRIHPHWLVITNHTCTPWKKLDGIYRTRANMYRHSLASNMKRWPCLGFRVIAALRKWKAEAYLINVKGIRKYLVRNNFIIWLTPWVDNMNQILCWVYPPRPGGKISPKAR